MTSSKRMRIAAKAERLSRKMLEQCTALFTVDTVIRWYQNLVIEKYDGSRYRTSPGQLHVCYNVLHFILEAPEKLIEKDRGRYLNVWDRFQKEKLERMKQTGIVAKSQKHPRIRGFVNRQILRFTQVRVETAYLPEWDSLSERDKQRFNYRRAMYAAQIDRFDRNVGRIMHHFEKRGILDNILLLFFYNNGCYGELDNYEMNWGRYTRSDYNQWRKAGEWSISRDQCWTSYSNTPLRKYKKFVHEGAISSPFIAPWPKGIKISIQVFDKQMFHLIVIMPKLCVVAGVSYPQTYKGRDIIPTQGMSMIPFITCTIAKIESYPLYWQHESHASVCGGDWKLVTTDDRDENAWELYNLTEDRSESEDLSQKHSQIVERLKRK